MPNALFVRQQSYGARQLIVAFSLKLQASDQEKTNCSISFAVPTWHAAHQKYVYVRRPKVSGQIVHFSGYHLARIDLR
ncbi:MAG TPA: hypothetical protein VH596_15250 [Terriglobales bacterium]